MASILKRAKFAFVIPRGVNCWVDIIPGRLRMRVRGLTMPLGVLYAATALRANGFEAVVLDADHRHMEDEAILAWLREAKPDVAGFSLLLGSHESAYRVARAFKQECPETLILCGGAHATHQAARIMETYPFVDMILRGEAEESIVRLAAALAKGRSPEGIPGLCLRRPGRAAVVPGRRRLSKTWMPFLILTGHCLERDSILFRSSRLVEKEASCTTLSQDRSGNRHYLARLSLPMPVLFLRDDEPGKVADAKPRQHPRGNRESLCAGYRTFFFPEDNFMVDAARVEAICDGLIDRKLKIQWATEGSGAATPKLLRKMKAAGCEGIFFGMESACQHVLEYYGKPVTPEQSAAAAKAAQDAGIGFVVGSFIFGGSGGKRGRLPADPPVYHPAGSDRPADARNLSHDSGRPDME